MFSEIVDLIQRIFGVFIWWAVIQPWEQGLRVRLGRHPILLQPGFHWRIPYVDAIYRQSVRRRYSGFGPQTVTTLDGHTLTIGGTLGYVVRDLLELYDRLQHPEDAIRAIAMGEIADFVSTHTLADCSPTAICTTCKNDLSLRRFGLLIQQFTLTTYARVRTYRLIMDHQEGMWGDVLDTDKKDTHGKS